MKYFASSYEGARQKFLEATKKAKVTSFEILPGLFMDCAFFEKKGSKNIVILQSGAHGVEGYIGGAFQLAVIEKILPKIDASVVLIHAVNPYGMKYNRRVNENNVDLNRNCFDDFKNSKNPPLMDKIIRETQHLMTPKRPFRFPAFEWLDYYIGSTWFTIKYGLSNIVAAAAAGQSINPKSVAFKGFSLQESNRHRIDYIKKITKGYKNSFLIDIHTGTGKKYDFNAFTSFKNNSKEHLWLKNFFGKVLASESTKNRGVNFQGDFGNYFTKHANSKKAYSATFEFGTVGLMFTVQSLTYLARMIIVENQVTHHGPKRNIKPIRKKFLKIYYPNTPKYRKFVIKTANSFSKKLIRAVASL